MVIRASTLRFRSSGTMGAEDSDLAELGLRLRVSVLGREQKIEKDETADITEPNADISSIN